MANLIKKIQIEEIKNKQIINSVKGSIRKVAIARNFLDKEK